MGDGLVLATEQHIKDVHLPLDAYQRPSSLDVPTTMSFVISDTERLRKHVHLPLHTYRRPFSFDVPTTTSFETSEPEAVTSHFNLPSRVALAFGHADVDAQIQQLVLSALGTILQTKAVQVDYVDKILQECAAEWDSYTKHLFPQTLANDTANLNGFRHYMIQDVLYLEDYYRVRTQSVSRTGSFEEMIRIAAKLSNSLGYVTAARADCTDKLGVPQEVVNNEPKSDALKNSIALHESVFQKDDWLDMHIVFLPCILGYYTIASKLLKDPKTIRNTVYYPLWIQAMSSGSSSREYRKFINSNIDEAKWEKKKAYWFEIFKKACATEVAFFGLASANFPTYGIVANGTYEVQNYRNDYFLVSGANSVITEKTKPAEGAEWILANTPNGYTIRNLSGTRGLLNVSGDLTKPLYYVTVSRTDQSWPINKVDGTFQ
ncbi:hypothetical protein HD554DRAFT_451703 [Boletus coccyginus]|nr:hypothetical protein HD554DRAFT_451703 [Boletus coccyginus]